MMLSIIAALSFIAVTAATHCTTDDGTKFSACWNNPLNRYVTWMSCNCEGQTVDCNGQNGGFSLCRGQSYGYPNMQVYSCNIIC